MSREASTIIRIGMILVFYIGAPQLLTETEQIPLFAGGLFAISYIIELLVIKNNKNNMWEKLLKATAIHAVLIAAVFSVNL